MKYTIEESTLTAIGNAIRAKTGKTDMIPPLNMPTEIESIQGGGDSIIKTVSGTCPITLEGCVQGNLLDYKIYGAEGGVGDKNKNLFNSYTLIKGYSGQWSDGSLVVNANGSISDYIDIEGASKVTVTILTETNGGASHPLYFYDMDKNYIQISDKLGLLTDKPGQRSKTFTVPEGAKYCRFYILTNYSKGNTVWAQVEIGDTFTGYVPYGYEVHVKVNDVVYTIPSIYPQLGNNDYIDFENRKVVIGGVSTLMELPDISLMEGSNTFDVETNVKPYNVELSYVKNSGAYDSGYADGYEKGDSNMDGILTRKATTISNDRITYLGMEVFRNYDSLAVADFPNVTSTGVNIFYACYALHTVNLPKLSAIGTNMFSYSSLLKRLDFPSVESIDTGAFSGCSRLVTLILRKTDTVCTLKNVNAFTNTPIAKGTGFVYVPDNLVDQYKAATSWSTYASQIKPISELEG